MQVVTDNGLHTLYVYLVFMVLVMSLCLRGNIQLVFVTCREKEAADHYRIYEEKF